MEELPKSAEATIDERDGWNSWLQGVLSAPHARQARSRPTAARTLAPVICYRFRTMKITRRAALKSSALAASALALARPAPLLASLRLGRRAHRHPARRADRHHLAGDLLPLHRASGRGDLRRRVGRARLEDRQHQRNPPGLHRHHARHPGPAAALAGRLLRRLVRLARRPGRSRQSPRAHRLLGPAGPQPLRPARVHAHLPRHRMQAVPGRRPALAARARLLPGDRVLQRARGVGSLELRRARHARTRWPPSARQMAMSSHSTWTCGAWATRVGDAAATCSPRSTRRCSADSPPGRRPTTSSRCASSPSGEMGTTWTGRAASSRASTPTPSGATSSASRCTTTPREVPRSSPPATRSSSTRTTTTTC